MEIELIAYTYPPGFDSIDHFLVACSQISFNSTREVMQPERYLKARIHDEHFSIIEHATASFLLTGLSRSCLQQLVRSRLMSYTVQSQRYVRQDANNAVCPPSIRNNPEAFAVWCETSHAAATAYGKLLDMGIPREDARFTLQQAQATKLVMSGNFRSWLHFIKLRTSSHAQWEIQGVAEAIKAELATLSSIFT